MGTSAVGTSGYQWGEYQEDKDQISGATYISDVVLFTFIYYYYLFYFHFHFAIINHPSLLLKDQIQQYHDKREEDIFSCNDKYFKIKALKEHHIAQPSPRRYPSFKKNFKTNLLLNMKGLIVRRMCKHKFVFRCETATPSLTKACSKDENGNSLPFLLHFWFWRLKAPTKTCVEL